MSVVTISSRSATLAAITFDQIQPGQVFWNGIQWNQALSVADGSEPDTITIHRRTPAGQIFETDYRRGRTTSVQLPHHLTTR